jgi:hypothetical protein
LGEDSPLLLLFFLPSINYYAVILSTESFDDLLPVSAASVLARYRLVTTRQALADRRWRAVSGACDFTFASTQTRSSVTIAPQAWDLMPNTLDHETNIIFLKQGSTKGRTASANALR